jgi:hypothetical protein
LGQPKRGDKQVYEEEVKYHNCLTTHLRRTLHVVRGCGATAGEGNHVVFFFFFLVTVKARMQFGSGADSKCQGKSPSPPPPRLVSLHFLADPTKTIMRTHGQTGGTPEKMVEILFHDK